MRREWIVDVLADLRAFAEHNGMEATAAGLEDAALVAVAELSSLDRQHGLAGIEAIPVDHGREAGNVTELFPRRGAS